MKWNNLIDNTEHVPKLKNRRATMFDVMLTMRVNSDPEHQFKEVWEMSNDEIKEVREYVEENREELEGLQSEVSKELDSKR